MILITGGAGYIGSHVNKILSGQGYETVVYDNLSQGHKEAVKWGRLEIGELTCNEQLDAVFSRYSIDTVFHFAASAYVGESVKNPSKYYNNNVINTIHLLDAMVKHGVKRIVFSSTCAIYGVPKQIPITEDAVKNPINPYGASKRMIERVLSDYRDAYGIQYFVLRYFNAAGADPEGEIGESHNPETHLIPLVLSAAAGDTDEICVFGTDYDTQDGTCIRDYVHVTDLADAHLKAMAYLKEHNESACCNLGNSIGTSVQEVIETAEHITGRSIPVRHASRRPGDPAILVGSADLAKELLGWIPRFGDVETILEHAWNWYCNRKY